MPGTFELVGVVHLVRPAGRTAHDLEALRAGVAAATPETLFHHALGPQLRHPTAEELPPDDFSAWVNGVVQDRETAERMSFAIQENGGSAEALRRGILDVLERVPEKSRLSRDAPEDGDFVFLEMDSVPVPSGIRAANSNELMLQILEAQPSVLFYHLVEQPWLEPRPLLLDWLRANGGERFATWMIESVQPGQPIENGRRQLMRRWRQSRLGRRVAEAAGASEQQRREAGRRAVAGLVRRMVGPEGSDDARSGS